MKQTSLFTIVAVTIFMMACHKPEPRRPVSFVSGSYLDESLKHSKALLKAEEEAIFAIIKEDSLNTYFNSSDGLWYHYITKNTTDTLRPQFGDQVNFTYNLRTFAEDTIYSMEEVGMQTYRMDQQRLMTGLREGLKIMKRKEVVTFLIPSSRAYGFYGDTKKIGSDVPIKATIQLNSIKQIQK